MSLLFNCNSPSLPLADASAAAVSVAVATLTQQLLGRYACNRHHHHRHCRHYFETDSSLIASENAIRTKIVCYIASHSLESNWMEHKSRARMSKSYTVGLKNHFQPKEKWQIGIFMHVFFLLFDLVLHSSLCLWMDFNKLMSGEWKLLHDRK